jgi:hypothetical protein
VSGIKWGGVSVLPRGVGARRVQVTYLYTLCGGRRGLEKTRRAFVEESGQGVEVPVSCDGLLFSSTIHRERVSRSRNASNGQDTHKGKIYSLRERRVIRGAGTDGRAVGVELLDGTRRRRHTSVGCAQSVVRREGFQKHVRAILDGGVMMRRREGHCCIMVRSCRGIMLTRLRQH